VSKIRNTTIIVISFLFLLILLLLNDFIKMKRYSLDVTDKIPIIVFSLGWHTGITIEYKCIPKRYKKYFDDFRDYKYIEISWGDAKFYQDRSPRINYLLAARAILLPTHGILHITGFNLSIELFYKYCSIKKINITNSDFKKMMDCITSYFVLNRRYQPIRISQSLYAYGWFYESRDIYIFPITCNVWTALILKKAGLDITPIFYQSATLLMFMLDQIREYSLE